MQKYVFQYYKVWEIKVTEKDDPKLPRQRNLSDPYEEGGAPVKFVSKFEDYLCQVFYQTIDMVVNCIRDRFQQKDYIETLQTMEILPLKALREEDFGHELQQMSSFFSSDLDKFELETQLQTLIHIVD